MNSQNWLAVSRNQKAAEYKVNSRFNLYGVSDRIIKVIDHMVDTGLVEQVLGYNDRDKGTDSRLSRIKPTPILNDYLDDIATGKVQQVVNFDRESIIMKDDAGNIVEYEDTKESKRNRADLKRYNKLLAKTDISIAGENIFTFSDKQTGHQRTVDMNSNKFVTRIHNRSNFAFGGRFYGGYWQLLPKKIRADIKINGQDTVEYDYAGLHISILAAKEQVEIDGDPYSVPLIDEMIDPIEQRKFLKIVVLVAINSKSVESACRAICSKHSKAFPSHIERKGRHSFIKSLLSLFLEKNSWMSKYVCADVGIQLMYEDSKIASMIINSFTKMKVAILCVHDSFIVPVEYEQELLNQMKLATSNIYGKSFDVGM
jgi:hypothetical protein